MGECQEFQGNGNSTHGRHTITYELPTTGKIANMLSGSHADNKIREGLEQARKYSETKDYNAVKCLSR